MNRDLISKYKTFLDLQGVFFLYLILKLLIVLVGFYIISILEINLFFGYDFNYYRYKSDFYSFGANAGYKWLIHIFGINALGDLKSIILTFSVNTICDLFWIVYLRQHLKSSMLIFFSVLLAIHPYAAIYSIKLDSVIFAKVGVLLFFVQLHLLESFQSPLSKGIFYPIWLVLSLLRNSNIFIFLSVVLYEYRSTRVFLISIIIISALFMYFYADFDNKNTAGGYIKALLINEALWDLEYIEEITGINYFPLNFIILCISRVLLLFGARERVFQEGLLPFINDGFPSAELMFYVVIGVFQFLGIIWATLYLLKKFGFKYLLVLIPLFLALVTVCHARYFVPYVPFALFGIAKFVEKRLVR